MNVELKDVIRELEALRKLRISIEQERDSLKTQLDRADGALADAETVPTGDIEAGIRALTRERDELKAKTKDLFKLIFDTCGHTGSREHIDATQCAEHTRRYIRQSRRRNR